MSWTVRWSQARGGWAVTRRDADRVMVVCHDVRIAQEIASHFNFLSIFARPS